jgi:hypothetical protein
MHRIGPTGLTGPTGPANFNPAVLAGPTGTTGPTGPTGPSRPSAGMTGISGPPGPKFAHDMMLAKKFLAARYPNVEEFNFELRSDNPAIPYVEPIHSTLEILQLNALGVNVPEFRIGVFFRDPGSNELLRLPGTWDFTDPARPQFVQLAPPEPVDTLIEMLEAIELTLPPELNEQSIARGSPAALEEAPTKPEGKDDGIPFMITQRMRATLRARGYTDEQIKNLTPKAAHEILGSQPAPRPLEIEFTRFTNADGPLTKRLSLAPDGTLAKDGAAGLLARGTAERIRVVGGTALAAVIEGLTSSQMLTFGRLRAGLPDRVEVTTKKKLTAGRRDLIARTGDYLVYDGLAYALLDFDSKGMPEVVAAELERSGGFWDALLTVLPELQGVARVMRGSTSAGLSRADTGEALPGAYGFHVIIAAKDGADIERFLRALHDRCWLAGLGWMMVSGSGALLERSIVDRMVGAPEHPVFEGPPVLVPPLVQDKESRRPVAVDGVALDTVAACPPLTIVERSRLEELKAKERERLAPETVRASAAFIEAQAKKLVARGLTEQAARQVIVRQCEGVLRPDIVLPFDDPELDGHTVGDVLADPERYEGETLADPLEDVPYGRCKAKIMRRDDGTPWIHSFAHGRIFYELKHDAASVRKAMEKAAPADVVATLVSLAVKADLDAVEETELRQLAKTRSGVGLNPIKATLKAAREKQAAREIEWIKTRRAARRDDSRPQVPAPLPDAEFLPVMKIINEVLAAVDGRQPPSRDIEYDLVRVRKLPVLNMHAFTPSGANPGETTAAKIEAAAKLPPPEQWVLCKMSEVEVTELIEQHINFYTEDKDGNRRSVRLPGPFVKAYMKRDDGVLPTVAAIATAPIVLADGNMLAPEGLDRLRGIQFIIPDELRAFIPRREDCTADAVKAAVEFLCNGWLVDVATDFCGKAVSIALALTLIERSLLDQRPTYRVTSGRRGSGKTTLIIMLILAVTGLRPAAAAWSNDENERRKALFAYLLAGVPDIVWDNIPRGTKVSCPHIERSCTTELYSDRVLGVSEIHATSASTINIFTGNNIEMKGDLASRDLHIRLDVDRADPENRNFAHPDPIGWTESHRGEILRALYTILLGNPQLKAARGAPAKTRFKMW